MSILFEPSLFPLLVFVAGGILLWFVNVLVSRTGPALVVGHGIGIALVVALTGLMIVGASLHLPAAYWVPGAALAAFHLILFLLPAAATRVSLSWLGDKLGKPSYRFCAILLGCGGAAAVSLCLVLGAPVDQALSGIEYLDVRLADITQLQEVTSCAAYTDGGARIPLRTNVHAETAMSASLLQAQRALLARHGLRDQVIYLPSGWHNCNCHGHVFADSRFWVASEDVPTILKDNRYQTVQTPRPGDVAVYRDDSNKISHTGLVRYVSADAAVILVESKWGGLGLFIHPHDVHCYGRDECTFYTTPRGGNRLHGIPFDGGSTTPTFEMPEYTPAPTAPLHSS
jgi:hypothetical protein